MRSLVFVLLVFLTGRLSAQSVDHWETIIYGNASVRYFVGTSDPGNGWHTPGFDDSSWPSSTGGIGYGDNDDGTTIGPAMSVFVRKTFSITSIAEIESLVFHIDYDDGFIAYINGVEIARANMGSGSVAWNQGSTGLHEATLYQGLPPVAFFLTKTELEQFLVDGNNTLAIQVHNENINSSDLSSTFFLSAGLNVATTRYGDVPSWFTPPVTFESSNLPIIRIETNGQTINDEPRIMADIHVIDNGSDTRNYVNDPPTFSGKASIEIRGESSQSFPKKSYTLETKDAIGNNLNVALLGLPPENDWVLYAPYTDKTMMRDVLAFKMGRDMGRYAPRTRYTELWINGQYAGVYVLMERIKRDKNRVDIATLLPGDLTGDELTGGYILRVDKTDGNDYPAWTTSPDPAPKESDVNFQFNDPDGFDLAVAQRNYIKAFLANFETALNATWFNKPDGYAKYIDSHSFVDFMIVNEIGKNIDGYIFSTYMHKDKDSNGGLLKMGPLWDFNLAFGNVDYLANAQFAPGWMYTDSYRMYWFRRLSQDPAFRNRFNCRYRELRNTVFTNAYFTDAIDSIASHLEEARVRNFQQWPILGVYIWPNQFVGKTYEEELGFLKTWIQDRLDWMDANTSVQGVTCSPVTSTDPSVEESLVIYPNPASGKVTIRSRAKLQHARISIRDMVGRTVIDDPFGEEFTWSVTGTGSGPGVYIISVYTSAGGATSHKVVIR